MRRSLGCTGHALNGDGNKGKDRYGRMNDVKHGLSPIAPSDARLFILGSLPGDASLAAGRYYAHPTNQFWRLVGQAIGQKLEPLDYRQRLDCLGRYRIGLWDVIASAARRGSLDQAIRGADHNALAQLLDDFPQVVAIAFNGAAAALAGRKLLQQASGLVLLDLPSSSAANTRPYVEKAQAWSAIAAYAGQGPCSMRQTGQDCGDD